LCFFLCGGGVLGCWSVWVPGGGVGGGGDGWVLFVVFFWGGGGGIGLHKILFQYEAVLH